MMDTTDDKKFLSDEEFKTALVTLRILPSDFMDNNFSPSQITQLCRMMARMPVKATYKLLNRDDLTEDDLLLVLTHGSSIVMMDMFRRAYLPPKVIEYCLLDGGLLSYHAINHPSCTEAQKVKYHLKYGV